MNWSEFPKEDPKFEIRRLWRVYFDIARREKELSEEFKANKAEVLEFIRQEKEAVNLGGRPASSL